MCINKFRKSRIVGPTGSAPPETVEEEASEVATRSEKSKYRYIDFYCFMSLADFTAYVLRDDRVGEDSFSISSREPAR